MLKSAYQMIKLTFGELFFALKHMPNKKNTQTVKEIKEKVAKAKSIIFTDYKGLDSNKANELRAKMLEEGVELTVAKNTLLNIALKEEKLDVEKVKDQLKGPTLALFSYKDSVSPLKALAEFIKKIELPVIKGAFIEKEYFNSEKVIEISKLPSKDQLISQVVWGLKSPLSGFVNVLGGSQRKLVYALSALAKKKQG